MPMKISQQMAIIIGFSCTMGIGMIRFLSKYVARDVLDQIYKLYVRLHLDYGDIV